MSVAAESILAAERACASRNPTVEIEREALISLQAMAQVYMSQNGRLDELGLARKRATDGGMSEVSG